MKKILLSIITGIACIAGIVVLKRTITKATSQARWTIGILQTASHPALDAARDGFTQELTQKLGNDVSFITRNGEGSIPTIHAIAQQFHNDKSIDAIFAIATPAAQAIATIEREKPIIIAAVTDPHALGIIHPTTNVTGVHDMINVPSTIDMLRALVPNAQKVGLLYHNGETNSHIQARIMQMELKKHGLIPLDFAISSESDLPAAAQAAFSKSDAILTPTDNMIATSAPFLASIAQKENKPIIASHNMLVKAGALAARGVDYFESGKQAATIAQDVLLHNKKPHEIPVQQSESNTLYINKKTLNDLGLVVPEALQHNATFIE